ncbi:MAG: Tm-1-like ATP-binding domain-containing protein, partial [Gemmobacter sp.]
GFEVAVFHTTGMGGMAFEALAAGGAFACVMDFSLQEVANLLAGSVVSAGAGRLLGAGRAGVPQIVAPGAIDMVDFAASHPVPPPLQGRPFHAHNRLIASAMTTRDERRACARAIADRLAEATGPVHLILPAQGIEAWDRAGEPLHDPEGLAAFVAAMRGAVRPPVVLTDLDAHINDAAFAEAALAVLDGWIAEGVVRPA